MKTKKVNLLEKHILKSRIEHNLYKEFPQLKQNIINFSIQVNNMYANFDIYCVKPGAIIGTKGGSISKIKTFLEGYFDKNKEIRIKVIPATNELNSTIFANNIATSIERNISNMRKTCYYTLRKILSLGALGAYIKISGKMGSQHSRTEIFRQGKMKYSGSLSNSLVQEGSALAHLALGEIGIVVKIMMNKKLPDTIELQTSSKKSTHFVPKEDAEVYRKMKQKQQLLKIKKEDVE